jgi:hypothetical protein
MTTYMPSLAALESNDDVRLAAELRLARLRMHAAVIRALADHIDRVAESGDVNDLRERLTEEKARLECIEAAWSPCIEDSGVFSIVPVQGNGDPS